MSEAIPTTMQAVEIKEAGPPETLILTTRPVPQPQAGDVLIQVAAAGVNRPGRGLATRSLARPPAATPDAPRSASAAVR